MSHNLKGSIDWQLKAWAPCVSTCLEASNFAVWFWVSRSAVSSETDGAAVRGVNRAEHMRVEETVVYRRCNYETTPRAHSSRLLPHLRKPGRLIKVDVRIYTNMQRAGCEYTCCLLYSHIGLEILPEAIDYNPNNVTIHFWFEKLARKTLYFINCSVITSEMVLSPIGPFSCKYVRTASLLIQFNNSLELWSLPRVIESSHLCSRIHFTRLPDWLFSIRCHVSARHSYMCVRVFMALPLTVNRLSPSF